MVDTLLVPERTRVSAKGESLALDLAGAEHPVFLLTLNITGVIEQESLDVAIFGSPDGTTWPVKPLETFPQKFYRGQHPMLLDLRQRPEVKFLRANWEVNRWGRGEPTPMFEFNVSIKEVSPEILNEATAEAQSFA
ncbi:MAG: hypothetical protein JO249_22575 [Acidobacteria bacterium]|nr:hypothetical protein [Acidobacteriota bacterium]